MSLVEEVNDDTYTLIVCGAEDENGPLKIYMPREKGVELEKGSPQYIKLDVLW